MDLSEMRRSVKLHSGLKKDDYSLSDGCIGLN
jgi:hypothetical protein